MAQIDRIMIELTVVIGEGSLSLNKLLAMGRGAIIPLGADVNEPIEIRANGRHFANGRVVLDGDKVNIELTGEARAAA